MLEVGFAGMPGARRERALSVPHLDEVLEGVIRLVAVGLVPVVAVGDRDGLKFDGVLTAAGQGECPGAVSAGRSWVVGAGECPSGWPVAAGGPGTGLVFLRQGWFCAAVRDGYSLAVGDSDAPLAVRAVGGGGGEVADQGGVEGPEAVAGAGPLGEAE